jgi:hypothetical protein
MNSPELIAVVLTGFGLVASISYYVRFLRLTHKTQLLQLETRQVQLFLDITESTASPEFQKLFYRVAFLDQWDGVEDYFARYGPENNLDLYSEHMFIWQRFDSLGLLLRKGVVDIDFLGDVLMASALSTWDKYAPVIREARNRFGQPGMWSGFEFLAGQVERSGLVKPLETTQSSV